jgi:PAS domain S-box-containing protein
MKPKLYVLIIEDHESDAALALRAIEQGGFHTIARQVTTLAEMQAAMKEQSFDIILADYNVPGFGAREALAEYHAAGSDIPFILISGTVGEETAVEMMKLGVNDYIMKDNLTRLGNVVAREIQEANNRRLIQHAERSQKEFAILMQKVQQMTHLGSWTWSIETGLVEWSEELYKIYECTPDTYTPTFEGYLEKVHPDDRNRVKNTVYSVINDNKEVIFEERILLANGQQKNLRSWASIMYDENERPVKMFGACLDITNMHQMQRALTDTEERLKNIVANNLDVITLLDITGNILYESASIHSVCGYNALELIGRNAFELIHPDDLASTMEIFLALSQNINSTAMASFRFLHKNGHYIHLEAKATNQLHNPSIGAFIVNSRDISERIEAQAAILETQRQITEVSQSIPGAVYQFHFEAPSKIKLLYISDSIETLLGLSPQILSSDIETGLKRIEPDQLQLIFSSLLESHQQLQPWLCYFKISDQNNAVKWIRCNAIPKKLDDGTTVWNGTLIDLTDAKATEHELHINKQKLELEKRRLSNIIEGTNIGTWEYNMVSDKVHYNSRWAEIIGYHPEELATIRMSHFKNYIHPNDLRIVSDLLQRHIDGKEPFFHCELRLRHKKGHYVWVLNRGKIVAWNDAGQPTLISGSYQDITDAKNTENLILRSAVAAEEKERERLSKELHDGIAQNMVAMSLYLSNLKREAGNLSPRTLEIIEQINELIGDTIDETRQVSHDLMPRVLNEHGLIGAIETLFDRIGKMDQIKYHLNIIGAQEIKDPLVSINLYRVVQEFIKNTQKYADASKITCHIEFKDNKLHLYIADDGKGFDRSLPNRGVGLQNMFSRINAIGGNYSLNTAPGQGVRLRVSVQLSVPVEIELPL